MFFKFKKNKYLKQISSESKIKISDYLESFLVKTSIQSFDEYWVLF